MIDHYDWSGGREAMLRLGPEHGPVVIVALPLFEEANRTRAFAVTICRALAAKGIANALPDLPGQGESLMPTRGVSLADLRSAFAAAARHLGDSGIYGVSIRSGALIDTAAALSARWHFAPMMGEATVRELIRTARAADPQRDDLDPVDVERLEPIEIAGSLLSPALLRDIKMASPGAARIVRLDTSGSDAELFVPGPPLWHRAEPDNDPALAALLADDIADWIARCDG